MKIILTLSFVDKGVTKQLSSQEATIQLGQVDYLYNIGDIALRVMLSGLLASPGITKNSNASKTVGTYRHE